MLSSAAHDVLMAKPDVAVQLTIAAAQGLFWFLFLPRFGLEVVMPWINSKPWKTQFATLFQKTFKASFFVDFELGEAYTFACIFQGIMLQHAIGGLLCLPAVFPSLGVPRDMAIALACHGALCEVGWELQDVVTRAYQVLFTKDGLKKNPPALLVILAIHHTLGCSMVIPMNLHYNYLADYHEAIFLLQFAACTAMLTQAYGFTLDITSRSGLLQMKACVFAVFCIMGWTRGVRYVWLAYRMISHFRAIGDRTMFMCAIVGISVMSIMNLLFLVDCASKLAKFLPMPLPKTEAERKLVKRSSEQIVGSLSSLPELAFYEAIVLSDAQKRWAKLRGVRALGVRRPSRPTALKEE